MREHGSAALVGPVHVACSYCHSTEVLPHDQAQRVMALRARLAHLRAAQHAEEAPALAFAQMRETLRSQLPMYSSMGALVLVGCLFNAAMNGWHALTVPGIAQDTRAEILGAVTTYPAISIGVLLGVTTGYVLALAEYKKAVAPTLRARAPMQPGMPARCRSCGASLATGASTGALVPCAHCGATNLVTDELARDRARFLEEETRSYKERAAGVQARAGAASLAFQSYFYIGGGAGLVLALVLGVNMRIALHLLFLMTRA